MNVRAFLCNYVESQNNMLFASGIGVDRTFIPPGAPGPWPVTIGIGICVTVPWNATNQQHTVRIELVNSDGRAVEFPIGPDQTAPFEAELGFNVGRPADLRAGDSQGVNLAITMPALPMPALGDYTFLIKIDGTEMDRLSYRLVTQQTLNFLGPGQQVLGQG